MIEVSWDGQTLSVEGHATSDSRCCAALSSVLWTLHTHYEAPEPTSGAFSWDIGKVTPELSFALAVVVNLAETYPQEVHFVQHGPTATLSR